jgi:transcriptional regulator CtsR
MPDWMLYLIPLVIAFIIGSTWIEIRRVRSIDNIPLIERRKNKKISPMEPVSGKVMEDAMELIDENKLKTRDGMRFIVRVMNEIHASDVERTKIVNDLLEQFDILKNKSVWVFAERYPKTTLLLVLTAFAWVTDEIRAPLIRAILAQLHLTLP